MSFFAAPCYTMGIWRANPLAACPRGKGRAGLEQRPPERKIPMRIFWCDLSPWLAAPSAALGFCQHAGIPAGDFAHFQDLARHAAGRFLLLMGYRAYAPGGSPPPLCATPAGKPFFSGGQPAFSISHAGNVAVCAFSGRDIGVDVERVTPVEPALFSILRPEELAYLDQAPRDQRARTFYRLWTRKESLVKASGQGLAEIFELESVVTPALRWKKRVNGFVLRSLPLPVPGYEAAVSARADEAAVITRLTLPDRFDPASFPL